MANDSNNSVVSTVIKLVIACLVVGYVIQFFEITPQKVLDNFGETVAALFTVGRDILNWASDYIVTGALIVLPIWGIVAIVNYVSKKMPGKKG